MKKVKIEIEVSARHMHLSHKDIDALLGKGYKLKMLKELSQPAEFACKEIVTLKTKKGELKFRVLGPERDQTQVEMSRTEAIKLGLNPPIRESHDLKGSDGAILVGPAGSVKLKEGVIVAWRHIHASLKQATKLGLKHGDIVSVAFGGQRAILFGQVEVKVHPDFNWHMHIDTDEANAANVPMSGAVGEVIVPHHD
jgi:putative phosphotransacetylase